MIKKVLALSVIVWISGCATVAGPEYVRPDSTPVKSGWSLNSLDPSKGSQVIRKDWWTEFEDPYLNSLVEKALSGNITIQVAAARVEEAKAGIQRGEAARLPRLSLGGGVTSTISGGSGRSTATATNASISGNSSWELDIWGKMKKGISAQKATYKASEADWRGTWLLITASVAEKYFLIRQFDELIENQQNTLDRSSSILSAFERQLEQGLRTRSEVMAQKAEINLLDTQSLELKRLRTNTQNELATLLGVSAGDFEVPSAVFRKRFPYLKYRPDYPPIYFHGDRILSRQNITCWPFMNWQAKPGWRNCPR